MSTAKYFFERDDFPSPYEDIIIKHKYFDTPTFVNNFKHHNNPIFFSINIQSLLSKIHSLRDYVDNLSTNSVPILGIAVQEIWQIEHPEALKIPGFTFIYQTRSASRGGGVGFYLLSEIPYKVIKDLSVFKEKSFESLTLQITYNKNCIILCNMARITLTKYRTFLLILINT